MFENNKTKAFEILLTFYENIFSSICSQKQNMEKTKLHEFPSFNNHFNFKSHRNSCSALSIYQNNFNDFQERNLCIKIFCSMPSAIVNERKKIIKPQTGAEL